MQRSSRDSRPSGSSASTGRTACSSLYSCWRRRWRSGIDSGPRRSSPGSKTPHKERPMDPCSPSDRGPISRPFTPARPGSIRSCRGILRRAADPSRLRHPGILLAVLWLASPPEARAFCGFYVGRADASLFNSASQVALVRDGDRTVISMLNDYQGDLKEFALVVPVPVVLEKGQIHVGDAALFKHLDAYSAPRLVEYFDADPCVGQIVGRSQVLGYTGGVMASAEGTARARSLGVTVEAQYTVGEYDIVILSAKASGG